MYLTATIRFPEADAPTRVARISARKTDDITDGVRDALERQGLVVEGVELFDD